MSTVTSEKPVILALSVCTKSRLKWYNWAKQTKQIQLSDCDRRITCYFPTIDAKSRKMHNFCTRMHFQASKKENAHRQRINAFLFKLLLLLPLLLTHFICGVQNENHVRFAVYLVRCVIASICKFVQWNKRENV